MKLWRKMKPSWGRNAVAHDPDWNTKEKGEKNTPKCLLSRMEPPRPSRICYRSAQNTAASSSSPETKEKIYTPLNRVKPSHKVVSAGLHLSRSAAGHVEASLLYSTTEKQTLNTDNSAVPKTTRDRHDRAEIAVVSESSASSNLIGQPTEKEVSDRTYNKASGGSFQNKAKNIKYFKKESTI